MLKFSYCLWNISIIAKIAYYELLPGLLPVSITTYLINTKKIILNLSFCPAFQAGHLLLSYPLASSNQENGAG